ncbi:MULTISPECIES: PstS family phosphate ABC transporter substrate-binding protein [Shewanella]|jgi:phosphate transport system substrate-binding protein|uniref:Phosphate-binding protein n=1 Tax=Shewanella fodinae TaxID=552357 RepID=A0A4R2FFI5_9GAMM|nr:MULTISPECIES: phosphate ABC transporter substrate-binding protein PstS family protein [Shewanella]MBO1270389.1 phosphate ABC transporter substrate-binding protein PstS family protein [Shewanella sp. 4t3-1-2LB]MCL2908134.1 phosphate ABC transporter substrate-binding protein PstS family protein [Shewanella fodinae]TCN88043.1 phosphate ABC transporter substrate-binding protein (PhoT family) [Shewanella fodinae]GGZ13496.1 phosphate-binding protein [Shewanella fodinae]
MKLKQLVGAMTLTAGLFSATAMAAVDPALPDYEKTSGVSGNFSSVGSDTLANMMTLWAEGFKQMYPNVNVQIQAAGSSTAPPALTEGTSQFGPMSRAMKPNEEEAFEKHYGYKPTRIRVAIDALAVFVHKDNPIKGLSLEQVDGIFSSTHKCGSADLTRWGDVGLQGNWATKDIQLYGRNSVSGTYGFFKEHALCKGDFKPSVNEQPGSASVVQSVSQSLNAVGYSGIGYKTAGVKAVAISKKGEEYIPATAENAATGTYPLSRYLYVYVNKHPNQELPPMQREFLRYILSKQGQQIVEKDGYVPLPGTVIAKDLAKAGIKL